MNRIHMHYLFSAVHTNPLREMLILTMILMMMMMRLSPRMLHLMGDCHKQLRVFRHKNLLLTKPHDTQTWVGVHILLKSWPSLPGDDAGVLAATAEVSPFIK